MAYDAFVLPKLLLARVLVAALLCMELARWALAGRVTWRRTPLDLPLLAFVASAALSTAVAVNVNDAVFGTYSRYEGLLTITTYALLFVLASQVLSTAKDARALARTLIASAYVVSALGIVQSVIGTALVNGHAAETAVTYGGVIRPGSTLGNANELAILLAMVLPLCIHETVAARSIWARATGANATVIIALALVLTFSRSAWLATSIGLLVLVGWQIRARTRALLVVIAGVAVLCGAGVAIGRAAPGSLPGVALSRLASIADVSGGSAGSRLRIWSDTVRVVAERPLTGSGPDTFGLVFPRHQTGNWTPGVPIDKAHSDVLQVAVTQGLVGVAAYLWVIVALLLAFCRGRSRPGAAAMFAGVLAYLIALQLNFSWVPTAFPFWPFAAAAVAMFSPPMPAQAGREARSGRRPRAVVAGLGIAVVAAAASIGTLRPMAADTAFFNGLAAEQRGQRMAALADIDDARSLAPWESAFAVRAGDLALDVHRGDVPGPSANPQAANADYAEAARLGTENAAAFRRWALAALALGDRQAALSAALQAVALDPYDPAARLLVQRLRR